ncbi:MAG: efflux RND transporter periplasmic adaptor subunit [Lysobacteraceae bacterium]
MDRADEMLSQLRIQRRTPAQRSRWPGWLWSLVVVVALLAGWLLLSTTRAVPVQVAQARDAAVGGPASVLDASGFVYARRQATVSAKITGKVEEVLIEEGMRVEAGQVMARLDPADAQAQLALAEAQREAARAQLGEIRANLELSRRTLERDRSLFERQLVARAQLDQSQAQVQALQARLASAQRQVAVADDQRALAAIGVENTIIRAPFAGVVTQKAAQPGEMISPVSAGGGFTRTGIGTVVDMGSLEVEVDVNEAFIGRVQPGMPVQAALNAYPDWRIDGEVIAIIPAADRTRATVRVRVRLDSDDPRIVPDMGVRVSFLEDTAASAEPMPGVWIPARALVETDDGAHVFRVADDRARRVAVETGQRRDADVHVPAGLSDGQSVVLSPEGLRDGQRVRVATR